MAHETLGNVDLLELSPVRLAEWEEKDGRVVVRRPRPTTRGLRGLADLISYWLSVPRIRLDEVGSATWLLLDGRRTVGEIAQLVRERFGDPLEPVEERTGIFVRTLRYQGFVAYPGWDAVPGDRGATAHSG
ncbi:MAG: PqqD family protein [Acidobacteria bacterium]|nr:PqqD family protein [Acidobacteriota bacterium]